MATLYVAAEKFGLTFFSIYRYIFQNLTFELRFNVGFYIHTYHEVVVFPEAVGIRFVVWETFIVCTTPKSTAIQTLMVFI